MANSLIDDALVEIAKEYQPGLLMWLRSHPDGWARLLQLEDQINEAALARDDPGLKVALQAYRLFFQDIIKAYGEGETLPLFRASGQGA